MTTTTGYHGLDSGQWSRLIGWIRENGDGETNATLGAAIHEAKLPRLNRVPRSVIFEAARHAGFVNANVKYADVADDVP